MEPSPALGFGGDLAVRVPCPQKSFLKPFKCPVRVLSHIFLCPTTTSQTDLGNCQWHPAHSFPSQNLKSRRNGCQS